MMFGHHELGHGADEAGHEEDNSCLGPGGELLDLLAEVAVEAFDGFGEPADMSPVCSPCLK